MSPEIKKSKKIPEIHFMPEGYVDPDQPEFLGQLLAKLQTAGFDTTQLVFSGLDGQHLYAPDGSLNRPNAIFGMNEQGWNDAIRKRETTPAGYVKKDAEIPVIAVFDAAQLSEPVTYKLRQNTDDYWDTVEVVDIVPKKDMPAVQPQDSVEEVIIHRDYPQASPTDALVALVYVEDEQYSPPRDHGL